MKQMMPLSFKSYVDLRWDVYKWSQKLPFDIVAVAGIPRSGIIPATMMALHRNIHLVTIEELQAGETPWTRPRRRGVNAKTDGFVLVVDDSVGSGGSMKQVKRSLSHLDNVKYGSVYVSGSNYLGIHVDFYAQVVTPPRCFEWNMFHGRRCERAILDIDGVLCEEPKTLEPDGPQAGAWAEKWFDNAVPKFPKTFPAMALCTSRLERHRGRTEVWLQRHGIQYGELKMSPYATAHERRRAGNNGKPKGDYFKSMTDAIVFIESHRGQSVTIQQIAEKPVICTDTMEMFK